MVFVQIILAHVVVQVLVRYLIVHLVLVIHMVYVGIQYVAVILAAKHMIMEYNVLLARNVVMALVHLSLLVPRAMAARLLIIAATEAEAVPHLATQTATARPIAGAINRTAKDWPAAAVRAVPQPMVALGRARIAVVLLLAGYRVAISMSINNLFLTASIWLSRSSLAQPSTSNR